MKKLRVLLKRLLNPHFYYHGVVIYITKPNGTHNFDTVFTAGHIRLHHAQKKIEMYVNAERLGLKVPPRKVDALGFTWYLVPDTAKQEILGKIERNEPINKIYIDQEHLVA